ncbi:hypothetical protein KI387_001554, partial [Taxus chinensis]
VHVGTLFEETADPNQATKSSQAREEEDTPNPKEEYILAMGVNKINSEALNHEQVAQEVVVFFPTSSLQKSNFLDKFELTSFMFDDEVIHDEKISDLK